MKHEQHDGQRPVRFVEIRAGQQVGGAADGGIDHDCARPDVAEEMFHGVYFAEFVNSVELVSVSAPTALPSVSCQ